MAGPTTSVLACRIYTLSSQALVMLVKLVKHSAHSVVPGPALEGSGLTKLKPEPLLTAWYGPGPGPAEAPAWAV